MLRTQLLQDVHTLSPCRPEEADSCMLLHVTHAAQHGHHQILIRTVDTDVVVLAVFTINYLPAGCELWLAFVTGKIFRYMAAHQIAVSLGPEMSCALPMFHALTSCDTVSSFAGHGKKTWSTWKSLPEQTDALLILADGPKEIPDDAVNIIERFVILLFDRTSTCTKVDHARRKLFPRKHSVQQIPPTRAALKEHVKRAVYQGGHIWGKKLLPDPVLPSPTDWGWVNREGTKTGCRNRYRCKKAALQCSGLCFCEGECAS